MLKNHNAVTLFDRLRRATALRVVLVVAMVLASQNSLACAFEEPAAAQGTEILASEIVSASTEGADEECCFFCFDCAQCGGCHSSTMSLRAGNGHMFFRRTTYEKVSAPTVAPKHWTPSALLRPPISAA